MSDNLACIGGQFVKAMINAIDGHPYPPHVSIDGGNVYSSIEGKTASGDPIFLSANFYPLSVDKTRQTNTVEMTASVAWNKGEVSAVIDTRTDRHNNNLPHVTTGGEGRELDDARQVLAKMSYDIVAAPKRCGLD
ncbi:MAG: hypothetical protein HY053_02745 [Proteobacteria bacterium]|nr:hypothetical protein [Pseudomonadota bacterium]